MMVFLNCGNNATMSKMIDEGLHDRRELLEVPERSEQDCTDAMQS